jgi:hypothetical protein
METIVYSVIGIRVKGAGVVIKTMFNTGLVKRKIGENRRTVATEQIVYYQLALQIEFHIS